MAPKSAFLFTALIVFSSAYPLAQAQLAGGTVISLLNQPIQFLNNFLAPLLNIIRGLSVSGILTCPGTSQPIPGALVSLNCSTPLGGTAILGQSTTTADGSFNITLPNILGLISPRLPLPCNVTTNLPINQTICPLVNTLNGTATTLTSALQAVSLTLFGLLRAILGLQASGFVTTSI